MDVGVGGAPNRNVMRLSLRPLDLREPWPKSRRLV